MNHRLLLLVTSPVLLVGLALVGACTAGTWAVNHLQDRLLYSFHHDVAHLRAAHDLDGSLRQLWIDSLLGQLRSDGRSAANPADRQAVETALARVQAHAPPEQAAYVADLEQQFRRYELALKQAFERRRLGEEPDPVAWAQAHPLENVAGPSRSLINASEQVLDQSLRDADVDDRRIDHLLLFLGLVGPFGGLVCGFSIARNLSLSIARIQVCVSDVHAQIAPEVALVDLDLGKGLDGLLGHLQFVVGRVRTLVLHMQEQQREILRTEQLAMVGQLASGIAHEIRNPLTAMKWLIEEAIRGHPEESLSLEDLRVLQDEAERMEQSVQEVLDFARPTKPRRRECDLRDVVRHAGELIRARKRQLGVICELDVPGYPIQVHVDAGQLKSALVNLLLNALDAMPRGGRLVVRASRTTAVASLVVEDSGDGIPTEVLDRLFTPFTTTKQNGTGLGLSVARRYVEEHGGRLSAENRPEGGARFSIVLPNEPQAAGPEINGPGDWSAVVVVSPAPPGAVP